MAFICSSMTWFMDQSGVTPAMVSRKCLSISMPPSVCATSGWYWNP